MGTSLQQGPNGRTIRGTGRREGSQDSPVRELLVFVLLYLGYLKALISSPFSYYVTTKPITRNTCSWAIYTSTRVHVFQLGKFTRENKVPLHMDGARVFNAAVRLGVPVSRIAKHCDSVTFCLSKGLGAPIGSVLTGEKSFIEK